MPTKIVKKCKFCGHHEYKGGCRLVTSLCANSPTKPSFVKPEELCKELIKLKVPIIPSKPLLSPFCNVKNKFGKEFDYGTFGGKAGALKTSKEEANINR
jgi:hypothetical protein